MSAGVRGAAPGHLAKLFEECEPPLLHGFMVIQMWKRFSLSAP